jgi:hypothetical protein
MKYVSFAWTTAAVQARCKDVTRREWNDDYAARFTKGEVVGALDKTFRAGGTQFGTIRLLEKPYKESEALMPDRDYAGEGFAFLDAFPRFRPNHWKHMDLRANFEDARNVGALVWVVRFEILDITRPLQFDEREAEIVRHIQRYLQNHKSL